MLTYKINIQDIKNQIFIPKYYDPALRQELLSLKETHDLLVLGDLIDAGIIGAQTGHEIGKMAYGTGSIPFVRTSDISNWEIKTIPKQGVSQEIYDFYAYKEDVQPGDILIVRDGTYLVGTSCLITEYDQKMLYCGGLIKIRVLKKDILDEYLLLGLLNSYIVKRQIRTKQFTRDVIDTLGQRLREVTLPLPHSVELRHSISVQIRHIIENRIEARDCVSNLSRQLIEL